MDFWNVAASCDKTTISRVVIDPGISLVAAFFGGVRAMSLDSNFRCDLKQVEAHSARAE
jgi:hypothetical protein